MVSYKPWKAVDHRLGGGLNALEGFLLESEVLGGRVNVCL